MLFIYLPDALGPSSVIVSTIRMYSGAGIVLCSRRYAVAASADT